MKNLVSAIIVMICFTVAVGCTKSASVPQPAPGKSVADTFAVKLWQRPIIISDTY